EQDAPVRSTAPAPQVIVAAPQAAPSADTFAANKPSAQNAADHFAQSSRGTSALATRREFARESRAGGRGGAVADNAADANLLVVHVDVKPDAYQRRAFDHVLETNGITIEDSTSDANTAPIAESKLAKAATPQRSVGAVPMSSPEAENARLAAGRMERQ